MAPIPKGIALCGQGELTGAGTAGGEESSRGESLWSACLTSLIPTAEGPDHLPHDGSGNVESVRCTMSSHIAAR